MVDEEEDQEKDMVRSTVTNSNPIKDIITLPRKRTSKCDITTARSMLN